MGVALRLRAPDLPSTLLLHHSPSLRPCASVSSSHSSSRVEILSSPCSHGKIFSSSSSPNFHGKVCSISCSSLDCHGKTGAASHSPVKVSRRVVLTRAAEGGPVKTEEEELRDGRILPYCNIDQKKDKRTLGELEADFLEALQSFYYADKPSMSNEEFDNLKEDLMWEGSSVVMLSSDEHRFMEASLAYQAGKPIISDADYDLLKLQLKRQGSRVASAGPRCSLRSRKVVSDSSVDYLKMTLLNLPAALIALGLVFFLDDITGFEITYLLELPEPYSFIVTWFIVLPITYLISRTLTGVIVKDPLILKGPCPNCGGSTTSFFGTILTVESGGTVNNVKCEACGTKLLYDLDTRLIEVDTTPDPPKKTPAKKPAAKTV